MSIIASILFTATLALAVMAIAGTLIASKTQILRAVDARHANDHKVRTVRVGAVRVLKAQPFQGARIIAFPSVVSTAPLAMRDRLAA